MEDEIAIFFLNLPKKLVFHCRNAQTVHFSGGKVNSAGDYRYHATLDQPSILNCLRGEVNIQSRILTLLLKMAPGLRTLTTLRPAVERL